MSPRTMQALLTRRPNRFGPDLVYVLGYGARGVKVGIVHTDETKDRIELALGDELQLGGETWRVYNVVPGVQIPAKGEISAIEPRAIVQLELR